MRLTRVLGQPFRSAGSDQPPGRRGDTRVRPTAGPVLALVLSGLISLLAAFSPDMARAANFVVTTTADGSDATPGDGVCETATGNGVCTLRAAIEEANALAGQDVITYHPNVNGFMTLTGGVLDISEDLVITGNGAEATVIDANLSSRVFRVQASALVSLVRLTALRGQAPTGEAGGGILNLGTLFLIDSGVEQGDSDVGGGGIHNQGVLELVNSTVSVSGGAAGGGILNDGSLVAINTFLWRSATGTGWLLQNASNATATLMNSTLSSGPGTSASGGGVLNVAPAPLHIRNTIIFGNASGADANCDGTVTSEGYNLLDADNCTVDGDPTGNIAAADALLGPMTNTNGPTISRALLPGSPAIDHRGLTRLKNRCDIGAFELDGIAGRVTEEDGVTGIPAAIVEVHPVDPGAVSHACDIVPCEFQGGVGGVFTAPDGTYNVPNVDDGSYRILARKNGFVSTWYLQRPSLDTGDLVVVSGGGVAQADFALDAPAGGITGTITSDGGPVQNAAINIYLADGGFVRSVRTNSDGVFDTGLTLAAGDYKFQVSDAGDLANLWSGGSATFEGAALIEVTPNSTASTGTGVSLTPGGSIQGVVTGGGGPLPGAMVDIFEASTDAFVTGGFLTEADGSYDTGRVLAAGMYKVRATLTGFPPVFYVDSATFAGATPVTVVADDDTLDIDIALDTPPPAPLTVHDEFEGPTPDPSVWSQPVLIRRIDTGTGRLEMSLTQFGADATHSMRPVDEVVNPFASHFTQADITVTAADLTGARARARLQINLYNCAGPDSPCGGVPGPGENGNVDLQFEIRRSAAGLQVLAQAFQCTNADCTTSNQVFFDNSTFTPVLGTTHTLAVAWTPPPSPAITYTFDGSPVVIPINTAQFPVMGSATVPVRRLSLRIDQTSNNPALGASVTAFFDNIVSEDGLYDDFSAPEIDEDKWIDLEQVRRTNGGVFESSLTRVGSSATNTLSLRTPGAVSGMQAEVVLVSQDGDPGVTGRSRLAGSLYSDGSGSGLPGDQTGDVVAEVGIQKSGATTQGQIIVFRCTDAPCTASLTELLVVDTQTFGPVQPGTVHRVGSSWDGQNLTLAFDGMTTTFHPTTEVPVGNPAPNVPFKQIASRVAGSLSPDKRGTVAVTFDNFVAGHFISGKVTAGDGITPLPGVTVDAAVSGVGVFSAQTDARGFYTIKDVPASSGIQVSATQDTTTATKTVDLMAGGAVLGVNLAIDPIGGTTATALSSPVVGLDAADPVTAGLGEVLLLETGPGALQPGDQVTLTLTVPDGTLTPPDGFPDEIPFALPLPTVSVPVSNGLAVGPGVIGPPSQFTFPVTAASSNLPGKILVSGIMASIPPAPGGQTEVPIGVTISISSGAPVNPDTVEIGLGVAAGAGPTIDPQFAGSGGQGATGQVLVIPGANFEPGTASVCIGVVDPDLDTCVQDPGITVVLGPATGSEITVTVSVAAGVAAGSYDVLVDNGDGTSDFLENAFAVTPPPQALSTDRGPGRPLWHGARGELVTITGSGFVSASGAPLVVEFPGTAGITVVPGTVELVSSDTLTVLVNVEDAATVPVGSYLVRVTNPDGGVSGNGPASVDVTDVVPSDEPVGFAPKSQSTSPPPPPAPSITGLQPTSGLTGSSVVINGAGFSATASSNSVTFAGVNGTRVPAVVTAASTGSLTVTVPGASVDGNVTVAVSGVLSNAVSFTVTNPRLVAVSPASATQGQAINLVLTGSKLVAGAVVAFSPPDGLVVGAAVAHPEGLQVPVTVGAAAAPSLRDVTVTNPGGGSATLVQAFEVKAPLVGGELVLSVAGGNAAYLPRMTAVAMSVGGDGRCAPATKAVTPVGVALQAVFVPAGAGIQPPAQVTFALTSSALPGTATNDDCDTAPAAKDYSVGSASPTSQQVTVAGGGAYNTTLFSHDWGGTVTIQATGTLGDGTIVRGTLILPVDTDRDGLPDAYESQFPATTSSTAFDQNGNGVADGQDRFARDGLANVEKYRGVYLTGPAAGSAGPLTGHQRLDPGLRHLFARGRGFGDDPLLPAGSCGINSATGAFVPDGNISAVNPCPPFAVGLAFQNRGVRVVNVTGSFGASTQLPSRSFANGTSATLDVATVFYDGVNCNGAEQCDQITKIGIRNWQFPTLGFSTFGSGSQYGVARVFKRAVEAYFARLPYEFRPNDPARVVLAPDGRPMLAPITLVADTNDNGLADRREALVNGQLAGDTYVPGGDRQLSALDSNNDRCVELPLVPDPTTISQACNPAAASGSGHLSQATKRQTVRVLTTHELLHAVGTTIHTTDPNCIAYQYTINWVRDNFVSDAAANLIQIHNKGLQ